MIETDALIIGAGPVGLFQVFELGLLEMRAHVVDALPHVGGQCIELYADKPIYDIPALPACTGRELVERLQQQIKPFAPTFHLGQEVSSLQRRGADGRFDIATSTGTRFIAKTVFIAAGVGAFMPRKLKLPGIEAHEHASADATGGPSPHPALAHEMSHQVLYRVTNPAQFAGLHLVVHGDEEPALDAALQFATPGPLQAASVSLLHRRDAFRAGADRVAALRAACEAGRIRLLIGQATGFESHEGRLRALHVTDAEGQTRPVPLDALLVLLGLAPRLGPVADWGLALERRQLVVDTERYATSEPGIFAVGDITTYPGKRKLILSGFHEATLAAFGAAAIVFPGAPVQLQYTTASPRLHALLGVASPGAAG